MNKILMFEDFTQLYKRWKSGEVRKEDVINKDDVMNFVFDYSISEKDVVINEDCADFNCNVSISDINDLKFKFGKINGDFDISSLGIESSNFFPKEVTGKFDISDNTLENFVGCPHEVGGDFYALDSKNLKSLKGLPKHIGGNLVITTPNSSVAFEEKDLPADTKIDGTVRFTLRRPKR